MPHPTPMLMSRAFATSLKRLSPCDRKHVIRAVRKLATNPRYPSLQCHRIQSLSQSGLPVWEAYASSKALRLVYDYADTNSTHHIRLWLVGSHAIIDAAKRMCHSQSTFTPITLAELDAA
jgi:hypothetical protein